MTANEPVPIARSALLAMFAVAGIFVLLLLVRPIIFSFAEPRDDTRYTLVASADVADGPRLVTVVLNDRHGLPGEVADGEHARLVVIVAPDPASSFSVVAAWSSLHDCSVTIGQDRLVDCAGTAWTFAGIALDPANANLVRLPARDENGAVIVDFTRPLDSGG